MPPSIAEVRPDASDFQNILGGTCPLHPIQCCIVWAARQEKIITPLAFRVYFASHEVKFWRRKTESGQPYAYQPFGFQLTDLSRLLPDAPEDKIAKAFNELATVNLLNLTNQGLWFAESLDHTTLAERVKQRARTMFNQLHQDTRDKIIKIPRRLLKLIVQCGRRIVRAATLIAMLLTTMLTKRADHHGGYQGCCKAEWIGEVFGVNAKRVNLERARLIREGWFRRIPTSQRVKNKWGAWVALNLMASEPSEPVDDSETTDVAKVQPPQAEFPSKMQPPLKKPVSPSEIFNNQKLSSGDPNPGDFQPKHLENPTWLDIQPYDLRNDVRSETLWEQAIRRGHLKNRPSDRINFFAAIAHALRVAKSNACGLFRTVVEKGLWHFISQADECNAIQRLRRFTRSQQTKANQQAHANAFFARRTERVEQDHEERIELSEDALIVQTLTADLKRAGVQGNILVIVQNNGYLQDWGQERWDHAEQELAQTRMAWTRRQYQAATMTSVGDMIEEDIDDESLAPPA